ncbi:hypothetical protein ACQ4PT_050456 [Festuca glaucescens]
MARWLQSAGLQHLAVSSSVTGPGPGMAADLHGGGGILPNLLMQNVASEPFEASPFVPKETDDDEDGVMSGSQQGLSEIYSGAITSEKENNTRESNVAKIKVVVRKRPLNRKEISRKEEDVIDVHNSQFLTVHEPKLKGYRIEATLNHHMYLSNQNVLMVDLTAYVDKHEFCFDAVLDEAVTNDEVYRETVEPIIPIIFQRTKATCFAYGQTGTQNFKLWLSYFEIYGGKLFDLLSERRVKSLSKGGNSKKEQFTGQFVSSSKESTNTSYPFSAEAEETMDQIQENKYIDASRKVVEINSSSSVDPDRNSFSMIPSYPHRGKEETSSTSALNDRERVDLKSNPTGYSSKAQSLQNSVNSQEEDKVTKVSPPRRKANISEKSERQSNYVKRQNGPEVSRIVHKQQPKQQQQRPSSTSASQVSSKQSEKESSCDDMEINAILEEMNLLAEVDQPGSLIDNYVAQLNFLLSRKASGLVSLQARLARFQQRLKEEEILSRKKPSR